MTYFKEHCCFKQSTMLSASVGFSWSKATVEVIAPAESIANLASSSPVSDQTTVPTIAPAAFHPKK